MIARPSPRLHPLFPLLAALLVAAPVRGDLLWQVEDPAHPEGRLHVLATVSFPRQQRLAFDAGVIGAFDAATRLLLPNSAVLAPQNALIGGKAHLEEGDALRDWLPAPVMRSYAEAVGRAGYPETFAEMTAPWFAARMVRHADRVRTGFAPEEEFERYFVQLAEERADPKTVVPLEESADSYDRYVALPRAVQVELVERAVFASARAESDLPAAAAAWKAGDAAALERILLRADRAHPQWAESRRRTTAAEAERLAAAAASRLAEPGVHADFLLADARCLLGADGALARLRARGLAVSPVPSTGTPGAPYPAPPLADPEPPDPDRRRVLLLGIDGATLRVITPMIEAGRLPNLASLAKRGASGPLRSHRPIYSPRIWNSIATGKTPAHHGIEGFTFRDASGSQRLYLSVHRKAHAIWNIASKAGLRVGVVNWWNSYPPEVVNGVMVSDHAKPTRLGELRNLTGAEGPLGEEGTTVHPPAFEDRVAEIYSRRLLVPGTEDPFLGNLGLADWMKKEELSKRFRDDAAAARIAVEVETSLSPELTLVFLAGIDRVSHRLWGALEPPDAYPETLAMSDLERAAARAALEAYYAYTDRLIGALMRGYDDDDLVMVVSDHGFEAGDHLGDLTGVHDGDAALDGILFARGPGIEPGADTGGTSVNDVTPSVLAWLGLPLGRDMDGSVAAFLEPPTPVEYVATHDAGEIERVGSAPSGSESEILDQLRALGYIE